MSIRHRGKLKRGPRKSELRGMQSAVNGNGGRDELKSERGCTHMRAASIHHDLHPSARELLARFLIAPRAVSDAAKEKGSLHWEESKQT
eukprot:620867-Rhodomonas_salina.1